MSCERWTGIRAGVFAGIAPVDRVSGLHSMTHRNDAIRREVRVKDGRANVNPYEGVPTLHFAHDAVVVEPSGDGI